MTNTDNVPVNMPQFGVSFSVKQCRAFQLQQKPVLQALLQDLGVRRFRLMSYWNECQPTPDTYNFAHLDEQIGVISQARGVIILCLGARQPRWPESHWPLWALDLPQAERYQALYAFIQAVVDRYKDNVAIISYQLENEALNRGFGQNGDFNRQRLRREFQLVRQLDTSRPIIMSTSNTWGIPLRAPRPDLFGFTLYKTMYQKGAYHSSYLPNWWYVVRAKLINLLTSRGSFIHELQAEPWGPKAIWEMTIAEQNQSMSVQQLQANLAAGKSTNLYPLDLWGAEWWYWRKTHLNDSSLWHVVKNQIKKV
jgi:hypothetical protein